jgi:hypothetical protein
VKLYGSDVTDRNIVSQQTVHTWQLASEETVVSNKHQPGQPVYQIQM